MYPCIRIYGYMPAAPAILDDLTALADLTRDRLLLLVESHELTVSELCSVLQLPQSTVSRHLKALSDSGWLTSRAEGTSRLMRWPGRGGEGHVSVEIQYARIHLQVLVCDGQEAGPESPTYIRKGPARPKGQAYICEDFFVPCRPTSKSQPCGNREHCL